MQPIIPTTVCDVVSAIVNADSAVSEIWLIGSRANGEGRSNSDWDLLVFGGPQTLEALKHKEGPNLTQFDILVVYNGDDFKGPLESEQRYKSGSLSGWEWYRLSEAEAEYTGTHRDHEEIRTVSRRLKAHRLWPDPTSASPRV